METVSQVNTMADFVRLVSAARSRNSGLVKNSGQTSGARSFQSLLKPAAGFARGKARSTAMYDAMSQVLPDAVSVKQQEPKQVLGTKFDAYA